MDCDSQQGERTLSAVTQEKRLLFSYVLTCSVDSFGFFFLFVSSPHLIVAVDFIGTMKYNEAFELFFSVTFFIVINL